MTEQYADEATTFEELDSAFEEAFDVGAEWAEIAVQTKTGGQPQGYAAFAVSDVSHPDESADGVACYAANASNSVIEGMAQSTLLRDLFPNPFSRVAIGPAWLTPTVGDLARAAYEMRTLPSGELDAPRLAVLSDALEEAGCTDTDLLDHLRSPGPHVRGCWALDLVLDRR